MLVVITCCRSPLAPTQMAEIDQPRSPLPYIANACFKCFKHFKDMLQLFHMDVAKVDQ
jgi:hypothetical protein